MKFVSSLTAFIISTCLHLTASITLDGDGGYRNIVIKVDNSVPEDYCHLYLQNIKEMLTEASMVLNSALDNKVYLAQVTLVIPTHWRNARCHISIQDPKPGIIYQKANIVIKPDSPIYGSQPYTQQSLGCGEAGDLMVIPQSFLTEWNATKQTWPNPGKLFVKEWAKLRYGVYDEHGYPGDPLYQNFYKVQDKVLHSGNSNKNILGIWLHQNGTQGCDPKTGACVFHPEGSNDQVTCSLGYIPNLPNVKRWCDRAGMPLSPTKHNILCSGRSAMQVIMENKDFTNITKPSSLPRSLKPRFDIVREPVPKYVLLIETSSSLSQVWKWVRKAVQNLIRYVVPDSTNVAVVTFNTQARIEHSMVQLTNETARSRMADSIPDSPNKLENNSEEGCFHCGIKIAMNDVLRGREAGGHLIIIAKDDISYNSANQEQEIIREAVSKGVRISSIVLTSQPALNDPPVYRLNSPIPGTVVFEALGKGTGGVSKSIVAEGYTMQMYSDLIESLNNVVALDTTDPLNHAITLHRQFYLRTDAEPTVGSFVVYSTLGSDTEFGIYVEDNEDHQIKSVEFTDNEYVTYGPYTKMSSSFDVVNFKTINFNIGEQPPFDNAKKRGSRWEYRIEWYGGPGNKQNLVTITSKPSAQKTHDLIHVKSWTNLKDGEDVTPDKLLAVFVQVEKGQRPILDARVRIYLDIEDSNGRLVEKDREITLIDNGYGEPDLTSRDGIYSRYITSYPTSGKYSYKIVVDDNSGFAATVSPGQPITGASGQAYGPQPCCGSIVPISENRTERIGTFRRAVSGTSVHIKNVNLGGADKIRPGKIGDLNVRVDTEAQQLVAVWTAPGGDFDDGEVMTYRFVFSQKIEELLTPSTLAPALDGLKESHPPGTRMQKVINFKYYSAYYYIGLYAFDEAGNRGRMSNIVLVRVPAPPTTTDVTSTEPIVLEPANDWTLLGAIIGAIGVLLLAILVGLYCRFFRRSQGRFSKIRFASHLKSNGVRIPSSAELDSRKDSSTSGGDGFEPEKTNNIVNIPHSKVSNTSFANNLTPTYWSASQLLAEHEVRKQQEQLEQLASLRSADQYSAAATVVDQYGRTVDQYGTSGGDQYGRTALDQYSRTNEGLWVEPEEYMPRVPGYPEFSGNPGGRPEEMDYPDVVNYNPGSNYSHEHITNDHSRSQYSNGGNPPGFSYRPEYAVHNDYSDYGGIQGDYSVQNDYGMSGGDLGSVGDHLGSAGDHLRDYESVLNKSSQRLMNSDVSSSTLGITNPSLLGSQLSIYSGVPGGSRNSAATKNRNITQV